MKNLYFCSKCRKIFKELTCPCGGDGEVKPIKLGTPVNVIGTKLKGKVYKMREDEVDVLITSNKISGIKTYCVDQIRKVL